MADSRSAATQHSAITAPTQFAQADEVTFAYRRFGVEGVRPVVFFNHLAANLDNFDPAVLDGIAREQEVITFDNRGVGSTSGQTPKTIEAMADDAEEPADGEISESVAGPSYKEEDDIEEEPAASDDDDDDQIERRMRPVEEEEEDNTLSLAQMEAQLKPEALQSYADDAVPALRKVNGDLAKMALDAGLVTGLEGRFGRARQFADEALAIPGSSGLPALIGARAAITTREFDAAETLLARPDACVPSLAVPRLMLEAEMKLEQGRPLEALGTLGLLRKEAGSHTAALRLELRALQGAGRYAEIPPLVDQLVKRKVYGVPEGEFVRAAAHAQELAARVRAMRRTERIVDVAVRLAGQRQGLADEMAHRFGLDQETVMAVDRLEDVESAAARQ